MTHKYEAYMQGAQLDYCIWGEKRRTPRVEMQKAENRFVLIIHPPVLILGPNGVFYANFRRFGAYFRNINTSFRHVYANFKRYGALF